MSTNALIGITNDDGTIDMIYNHWDGYPEGVGKILIDCYNTKEKLRELINLGNISSLDEDIDHTTFYHRDRDEDFEENKPIHCQKVKEVLDMYSGIEYVYLYINDTTRFEMMDVKENVIKDLDVELANK